MRAHSPEGPEPLATVDAPRSHRRRWIVIGIMVVAVAAVTVTAADYLSRPASSGAGTVHDADPTAHLTVTRRDYLEVATSRENVIIAILDRDVVCACYRQVDLTNEPARHNWVVGALAPMCGWSDKRFHNRRSRKTSAGQSFRSRSSHNGAAWLG
jgi:hypothetical protein